MALISYVYVDDRRVGTVVVTRRSPGATRTIASDDVHVYDVESEIGGVTKAREVVHRYGDGAAALLAKAMEVIA